MTTILHTDPDSTPRDGGGKVMPFAVLTFMRSGTVEVLETYTADEDGVFEEITPDFETYTYRVKLTDRWGVLRYDVDPYLPEAGQTIYYDARIQALDAGEIVPGAELTFETEGVKYDIFAASDLKHPLPNPVQADASGLFPAIYLDESENEFIAFVIVGASGTVITSLNGFDWVTQTEGVNSDDWRAVCWASDIEKFCAVANLGGSPRSMLSDDGETWAASNLLSNNRAWSCVQRDPSSGVFAAVTAGGAAAAAATSADGAAWSSATAQDRFWEDMAFSPSLGLFAACATALTSTTKIATTSDGTAWTLRGSSITHNYTGIVWAAGLGKFITVGSRFLNPDVNGAVGDSTDGMSWNLTVDTDIVSFYGVAWSESLELLCAAVQITTGVYGIKTSADGATWTARTVPDSTQAWNRIAWSEELGLFAATSSTTSGTNRVMTSPNGVDWTLRTTPANTQAWTGICASD